jgi:hypothetical protein
MANFEFDDRESRGAIKRKAKKISALLFYSPSYIVAEWYLLVNYIPS